MISVATVYPCHGERGTLFRFDPDVEAVAMPRTCRECLQEYEVRVTILLDGLQVECEWRPVTRIVGEPVANVIAYIVA
jgi:hypothetical protein